MASDLQLIETFRDKVNSHGFVFFRYCDVNGKDQWSCLCSAMDWITVAMEYIIDVNMGKRSYKQSMEMYAYISSIDVVWEAIQQLHRVLFQSNDIPFKSETDCFDCKILKEDDNTYFKTLRASFGAHPVNLNGQEKGEKYFASWSGELSGQYSVLLYSNKVGNGFRTMYLNIKELNKFLDRRYSYLNQLMNEIDRQYSEFKYKMQTTPIKKTDNIREQLLILQEESSKRNNLYQVLIEKLIMIFNVEITNEENQEMVMMYKVKLKLLVSDIHRSLQTMDDRVNDELLYQTATTLPNGYIYLVGKLWEYINGVGHHPNLWEKRLTEIFAKHFVMEYSTYDELYILIISCINKLNNNRKA